MHTLYQCISHPCHHNRTFPIPIVFEQLFDNLPKIDIHDHLRQGTLALEKSWATHSWTKRVFSTVLGVSVAVHSFDFSAAFLFQLLQMSMTDAFFAFNIGTDPSAEKPSFADWLSRLAHQLINNEFDQLSLQSPPSRRSNGSGGSAAAPAVASHEQHSLLNLSLLAPFTSASAPQTCCMRRSASITYSSCRHKKPSQAMQRKRLYEENRTVLLDLLGY